MVGVSEFWCQCYAATPAPCIFQPGSSLTADTVFVFGGAIFDLQADGIMPTTKGSRVDIRDNSVAKLRSRAWVWFFCYLATVVSSSPTFDYAQFVGCSLNSTTFTINGPTPAGSSSTSGAGLTLSGGAALNVVGPIGIYGNVTDDGTGTLTTSGSGSITFDYITGVYIRMQVNNLVFGGASKLTTASRAITLDLVAPGGVILKDTALLAPSTSGLIVNAPNGLVLQDSASVVLQSRVTVNGPFSMESGGYVTLYVNSSAPSAVLQLIGSSATLAGGARLNFTTYVPPAAANFTVATFVATHSGTWAGSVASPYASWFSSAYDTAAAYVIGVIPRTDPVSAFVVVCVADAKQPLPRRHPQSLPQRLRL